LVFHGWENFFFMTGSAAAGLIGLLFVVVTLTGGFDLDRAMRGQRLYMTPTAFQFTVVLTLSSAALAPRTPAAAEAAIVFFVALAGVGWAVQACWGIRAMRRADDAPHWSDFWLYGALPALLYIALIGVAAGLRVEAAWSPYALAVVLMAMLIAGIRNAWDLITWMAPRRDRGG
jgi:hypothetical protein